MASGKKTIRSLPLTTRAHTGPVLLRAREGKKASKPRHIPDRSTMHAACCLTPTFRRQFGPLNSRDEVTDTRSPPSTGAEVDPTCQFETRWGMSHRPVAATRQRGGRCSRSRCVRLAEDAFYTAALCFCWYSRDHARGFS